MNAPRPDDDGALEERLGYTFLDRQLLEAALTHTSALPPGGVRAGEQLEYLGDAVLGLVIADLLLRAFPQLDEGELSRRRATLVRAPTLAAPTSGSRRSRRARARRGEPGPAWRAGLYAQTGLAGRRRRVRGQTCASTKLGTVAAVGALRRT